MAEVTELVTKFSFSGSLAPLEKYNVGLAGGIKGTIALTAAAVAAAGVFAKWSAGILQSLDPLVQLERRTGVAVARIQELSFVAEQTGSSASAVQSTILSLNQTIGDAALFGSEEFARLGISVRDSNGQLKGSDQVLGEVQRRFAELNLSMAEQESIASALGIDPTLVQMLNLTSGELETMTTRARELGTLTSEQTEQVNAYNKAINEQRFAVGAVKNLIAVGFAPTLTELTSNFTDLIAENKDWIINGAEATIDIVSEVIDGIGNIAGAVFGLVDAVSLGHGEMTILIGILAGAAAAFPVTAAIIAVTLAVEDLITAFQGGESAIADFFEDNFGIDIVEKITDVTQAIKDFIDAKNFLMGNTGFEAAAIPPALAQEFSEIPIGRNAPGQFAVAGNRTIEQNVSIDIKTNDPAAAGRAVADNLQGQLENAEQQLTNGGR